MAEDERRQGGRPRGVEVRNREQLRYDLARIGDRSTLARRLRQATQDDQRRTARKYPYLPQAATIWEWLDKGKPVAWPGHALRDLARYIQDQTGKPCDPDAWKSAPALRVCNAPRKPSLAFRGRESELDELKALLARGAPGSISIAIEGLPGVGKTELALQLAHAFASEAAAGEAPTFPRGIFWLNAENPDLTAAWDEIARKWLDVEGDTSEERVSKVIRRLETSSERSLVILDNAFLTADERWEEGLGKPAPLPDGPGVGLLVTTLNDYFGGAAFLHRPLEMLSEAASRELLLGISRRDGAADPARLEGLDELLRALGGHALALEISAVFLQKNGSETPRSLLQRIAQGERFERLARHTGYAIPKSSHEATLHGAFDALWNFLDEASQISWRLAAQLEPVPVGSSLSEAVGLSTDLLETLHDVRLIEWDPKHRGWVMHRLTRAFATEISTPDQRAAAQRAFVDGCAAHAARIDPDGIASAYLADRAHLDAAVALSSQIGRPEAELKLLLTFLPEMTSDRGPTPDLRARARRAIALAEQAGTLSDVFRALEVLWWVSLVHRDGPTQREMARRIDELARQHATQPEAVSAHLVLGQRSLFRGWVNEAYAWLKNGLSLAQDGRGRVLFGVYAGLARCCAGYPDEGLKLSEEALRLARSLSDPIHLGLASLIASLLRHHLRGEVEEASRLAQVAAEIGALHRNRVLQHISALALAFTRIFVGSAEAERDLEVMRESLEKLESIQLTGFRAFHLGYYAEACLRLGRRDEASAAIDEALGLSGREGMLLGDLLRVKAMLAESREEAVAHLERALEATLRQGGRWLALRVASELVERSVAGEARERALDKLRELHAELVEGLELPDVQRARALLA